MMSKIFDVFHKIVKLTIARKSNDISFNTVVHLIHDLRATQGRVLLNEVVVRA